MSTDTPLPDDETRAHATAPAEGGTAPATPVDGREHASEPAEGEDVPDA